MKGKDTADLARRLVQEPPAVGPKVAAVAVILLEEVPPKTLLIKRAERKGDPWSGQIAFPGGKFHEGDNSPRDTAVREAREEVGIDLETSEFLGYFGPFRTHTGNMEVVPAVFRLRNRVPVVIDAEASSYRWVELESLAPSGPQITGGVPQGGMTREVPAIKVGDYVIWGLTHRVISALLADP
jgi:8-oxo-dGTP pyrophosphatase MutT (NUDIX family)